MTMCIHALDVSGAATSAYAMRDWLQSPGMYESHTLPPPPHISQTPALLPECGAEPLNLGSEP
jgi:hypothetical protein